MRSLIRSAAICLTILMATLPSTAADTVSYFNVSAHNAGLNQTMWITDARVLNPDAVRTIEVALAFLPAGSDNSAAAETLITIQPRRAVALDDVVASLFGEARLGAIRLSSTDSFLASSRTYNIGDGQSGTYGQYIGAVGAASALSGGILIQLANDPASTGFRTNVGFVNPHAEACTVNLSVYDLDAGVLLGTGTVDLPPFGFEQIGNIFGFVQSGDSVVPNGSVEYLASPSVLAYASVVDNTSGDAIFILPAADNGTPIAANNPPEGTIISPSADVTITQGEAVTFAGSASDPDGDGVSVLWDYGDGMTAALLVPGDHVYSSVGTYTVRFTATDGNGDPDPTPDTRTITVREAATKLSEIQSSTFTPRCTGCHGGANAKARLNLSNGQSFSNLVNVPARTQSGTRVIPYDPERSVLVRFLQSGHRNQSASVIEAIRSWINTGAQDN